MTLSKYFSKCTLKMVYIILCKLYLGKINFFKKYMTFILGFLIHSYEVKFYYENNVPPLKHLRLSVESQGPDEVAGQQSAPVSGFTELSCYAGTRGSTKCARTSASKRAVKAQASRKPQTGAILGRRLTLCPVSCVLCVVYTVTGQGWPWRQTTV